MGASLRFYVLRDLLAVEELDDLAIEARAIAGLGPALSQRIGRRALPQ